VVNLMFDDASRSAASESEIQSDGGLDIGQSGSFEAVPPLAVGLVPDAAVSVPLAAVVLAAEAAALSPDPAAASFDPARDDFAALERSLRAQPLPVKCTAGAEKALFIAPPHWGQTDGPWLCTECITSIVWPHLEQT
jgi:hypothetical protein